MSSPERNVEAHSTQDPAVSHDADLGDVRVTVHRVARIADPWLDLERFRLDVTGPDGVARRSKRVVCGRGDRVAVLAAPDATRTVLLVRVLRIGPLLRGVESGMLLEAPGGLVDGEPPELAAQRELLEETGCRARDLTRVATVFTAPQFSAEMTHLFLARYDETPRRGPILHGDGEVTHVVEMGLDAAFSHRDTVIDAKTAILLAEARARWTAPPA